MNKVIANKDKYVVALIHELAPYFVALGRNKLKYTFLLEPYFSSTIGFEIFDGRLCIGIPEKLYYIMAEVRFFGISYIPEHAALFFLVDLGSESGRSHPMAFRIYLRKERVKLLENFRFANIVRMGEDKKFNINSRNDTFKLILRKERKLVWEDY